MRTEIDILENEIIKQYPGVLEQLLKDHTTGENIFWATKNYEHIDKTTYNFISPLLPELITGENGNIIMPRVQKDKLLQKSRSKDMAEVFTPSWICNAQNNLIDNAWFGREEVFNKEITTSDGKNTWIVNEDKITFPEGKTWQKYVRDTRLEITCGEAPYITSRYDTTTGEFIPVEKRIGLLDRKLRVISENIDNSTKWLHYARVAYKNTYAFEWQGDSLLIAREAMLVTFIENFKLRFGKEPKICSIKYIAYIISWNVFQMDGLKGVVPYTCKPLLVEEQTNMYDAPKVREVECPGCRTDNIKTHTGTYCLIRDWPKKGKDKEIIKFIDLIG